MKGQTEKRTKRITVKRKLGGALGAALGLSLSLLFLPLEVQAAGTCKGNTCVGYNNPNVEHDHSITLDDSDTFSGGTVKGQLFTNGEALIKNGTFQCQVDVYDTGKLTIENGSFLVGIMVYGEAIIEDGNVNKVEVSSTFGTGKAEIRGGTFKGEVIFNRSTSGIIKGGVFEKRVVVGSSNVTITGGTFLGGVQDSSYLPYNSFDSDFHTIELLYSDGTTKEQIVVGSSTSVKPNDNLWLDEDTEEEYEFGRKVTADLTLIEKAKAPTSEGGGGAEAEAERLPEGGHTEKGKKEDQNVIPVHTCAYEWVTVREVGAGVDGEEWYQCKLCGSVESVQIIPAASYQTARLYEAVGKAQEAETVTYDLGSFHTITDTLLTTLQDRSDVTLVLTFTYQGRCYETTFPKGADYTELLEDEDFFYGLLGLNGRSGIVTQDVTP